MLFLMYTVWLSDPEMSGLVRPRVSLSSSTGHQDWISQTVPEEGEVQGLWCRGTHRPVWGP